MDATKVKQLLEQLVDEINKPVVAQVDLQPVLEKLDALLARPAGTVNAQVNLQPVLDKIDTLATKLQSTVTPARATFTPGDLTEAQIESIESVVIVLLQMGNSSASKMAKFAKERGATETEEALYFAFNDEYCSISDSMRYMLQNYVKGTL